MVRTPPLVGGNRSIITKRRLHQSIINRLLIVLSLLPTVTCRSSSEVCWDNFDMNYRNQCNTGQWQQRFYFDHASLTCRQFWYDGCRGGSRNMFEDALTCQWLCEAQPMYKSKSCLEDFDHRYKDMCNGGRWRQQFYFDRNTKKCIPFWYDGCRGSSQNLFPDELTCLKTCEDPASRDQIPRPTSAHATHHPHHKRRTTMNPRVQTTPYARTISAIKPWHSNDKHRMQEKLSEVFRPNTTNVCDTANPCQNNATCIFAWKKNTYYCKCKAGWTGSHCTEVIQFDPCAKQPCKNGATCKAKHEKGKSSHECYCATGYGGLSCDERPCDSSPCLNNGTCRTTAAASTYFCDCQANFGGKSCEFGIGQDPKEESFGKAVEQISSGKQEWVDEMKARMAGAKPTTTQGPQADEQYKDPKTKKQERAEREKAKADEEYAKMKEEQAKRDAEAAAQQAEEEEKKRLIADAEARNLSIPLSALSSIPSLLISLIINRYL